MSANPTTAAAQATAAAVVVAMPSHRVTTSTYSMWFTKAVKHANKRLTRPPWQVSL